MDNDLKGYIKRETVSLSLDKELNNKLAKFCEEQGMIKSRIVENLIKQFLKDKGLLEDE